MISNDPVLCRKACRKKRFMLISRLWAANVWRAHCQALQRSIAGRHCCRAVDLLISALANLIQTCFNLSDDNRIFCSTNSCNNKIQQALPNILWHSILLHWLFHTFPVEVWFLWFLYGRPSPGCRGTRRNATYRRFDDGSFQWCQCGCRRGSSDFNRCESYVVSVVAVTRHLIHSYPFLSKKCQKKAKRHVGDDHIARCILSVESATSVNRLFSLWQRQIPPRFHEENANMSVLPGLRQNKERKGQPRPVTSVFRPLRGTQEWGLHEPQVDTIQMAGTGLWPTTLRATGSQHEEANYAALDPAIPKFFNVFRYQERHRSFSKWWTENGDFSHDFLQDTDFLFLLS